MRIVKYIAIGVLVIFCIVFSSEMFQNHVETFTSGLYFSRITDTAGDDIYALTEMTADNHGVGAFAVRRITNSFDDLQCVIFTDERSAEILKNRYEIFEETFSSLLSGKTKIVFEGFDKYSELSGSTELRIYFTGDQDQVLETVAEINNDRIRLSTPAREMSDHSWVVYAVWGVVLSFFLLLTWFSLQFDRKKDFIRISMGVSRSRIIAEGAILDAAVFAVVYVAAYMILKGFIYTGYAFRITAAECVIFVIINSALHLTLLRYDYKAIVYGANLNQTLLVNCYVLKALVMVITIASVSFNVVWIRENAGYLGMYRYIYEFEDYYKLDFELPDGLSYEESRILSKSLPGELLVDGYCDDKVALASMIAGYGDPKEGHALFIYNKESRSLLRTEEIRKELDEGYDFYLFIPEKLKGSSAAEQAESGFAELLYYTFDIKEGSYSRKTCYYNKKIDLLYFEFDNLAITEYGFEIANDPMFIYCAASPEEMGEMIIGDGIPYTAIGMEVLFNIDEGELTEMADLYGVKAFERTSAVEICERHKAVFLRVVLMNSLISAFMLLLAVSIMISIIKLEYRVNAKLLAVKKILGYPVIRKNLFMMMLNALTVIIGMVANLFIAVTLREYEAALPCYIGLALMIVETVVMVINMEYLEKTSTAKILKGGSL